MIRNKHKLAFLLCLLLMATTAFGASEAEYKKLAKTWTLNADGSQEFRYDMELTLFTHTAMNGTYGESFIVYNPQYQELKINSSYTKQKDGTIVKTPDNAFVEVLPRNAADAPAYNHLKEWWSSIQAWNWGRLSTSTIQSHPNRDICRRWTFSKNCSNPLPSRNTP